MPAELSFFSKEGKRLLGSRINCGTESIKVRIERVSEPALKNGCDSCGEKGSNSWKNRSCHISNLSTGVGGKDRRKKIQKAFFSGYLFAYENLTHQNWLEILKTPGVVKILGNEAGPIPVPEIQIESIQKILAGRTALFPFPYLKEGQLVRVVDGPLKGCEGFLLKIKEEKEKLVISIDLLQRSVSVEIDGANIEPIIL